jgi:hypothetical protein
VGGVARTILVRDQIGVIVYAWDDCESLVGNPVLVEFSNESEDFRNNPERYREGFSAAANFIQREWKCSVAWFNPEASKLEIFKASQ